MKGISSFDNDATAYDWASIPAGSVAVDVGGGGVGDVMCKAIGREVWWWESMSTGGLEEEGIWMDGCQRRNGRCVSQASSEGRRLPAWSESLIVPSTSNI